jgi:hypothetical protein
MVKLRPSNYPKEMILGPLLSIIVPLMGFGLATGASPENGLSRAGGEGHQEAGLELISIIWKWQETLCL